ncbi:uncharacterized protein TNCV_1701711 [Trichonephila clavipes]|nr:uncharacterized protein TNCV_1701711 [Trichonephila clavipes]
MQIYPSSAWGPDKPNLTGFKSRSLDPTVPKGPPVDLLRPGSKMILNRLNRHCIQRQGRNESCQNLRQVGLLHNRWRHHLFSPPQFRHGTEGNILQSPAPVVSAATAHKTFGATDLMNTYFVCTLRVFGRIRHRTQALRSGVRCSNH